MNDSIFKDGYVHQRDLDRRQIDDAARIAYGAAYGRRDLGDRAVLEGWPLSRLERSILDAIRSESRSRPGDIDMTRSQVEQWSLLRLINAVRHDPMTSRKTLEGECSDAIAKSLGREADVDGRRFFVPLQVLNRTIQRDLTVAGSAGKTVGNQVIGFSPSLRAASVLRRLGALFVGPFGSSAVLPAFAADATETWLTDEADTADQSEATITAMSLSPKTVSRLLKVSNQLTRQTSVEAEMLLFSDLGAGLGVSVDTQALGGDGAAGRPLGVINNSGVGTFTGASIDYAAIRNAQQDLALANGIVDPDSVAWIAPPAVADILKSRYRVASTDSPIWQGSLSNGSIDGERAVATTSAPDSTLVYCDLSQIVVAEFGVMMIEIDPFTDFRSGKVGIRAMWSVDVGLRHAASLTVATSVS